MSLPNPNLKADKLRKARGIFFAASFTSMLVRLYCGTYYCKLLGMNVAGHTFLPMSYLLLPLFINAYASFFGRERPWNLALWDMFASKKRS
jgi:hypothetical protein